MDNTTIARYQPGGDIYQTLLLQYGQTSADAIAAAAETGDNNGEVAAAIAQAKYGAPADDSTADAFITQITTDPLGAPLDDLESGLQTIVGNSAIDFLKSPIVLIGIGAVVFFSLGGGQWLGKKILK